MTTSHPPDPEDQDAFEYTDVPPPPPMDTDEDNDVGLATEMVFSGKQRAAAKYGDSYERLQTGEVDFADDEEQYDDIDAATSPEQQHHTEFVVNPVDPDDETTQPTADDTAAPNASSSQYDYGQYQPTSFDPKQYYSQQTGTTNEPLALTMLVVLLVVAVGIFGTLAFLLYRLFSGM